MSLFRNTINYIRFMPKHGTHKGKFYLFEESNKRWSGLRSYAKLRKEEYLNSRYFCITGLDEQDKWKYSNYQDTPSSANLPLPEVIYDILKDKVYVFKGQLWTLNQLETETE